mgnify:CR=1 FL=1|tara:strand:- start:706 stop:924 length:219 start_codon:yes stop_codon:yes gene_type:complete
MTKKTKIEYGTPLSKGAYARLQGVNQSRITVLLPKLYMETILGREYIIHTKENAALFSTPSHSRGKKRTDKK